MTKVQLSGFGCMSQEKHEPSYIESPLHQWFLRVQTAADEAVEAHGNGVVTVVDEDIGLAETTHVQAYFKWMKIFLATLDSKIFPLFYGKKEAFGWVEAQTVKALMALELFPLRNGKTDILEPLGSTHTPFPANHPMLVDFIRRLLLIDQEIPEGLNALMPVFCATSADLRTSTCAELERFCEMLVDADAKQFLLPDLREHLLAQYYRGALAFGMQSKLHAFLEVHKQSNEAKLGAIETRLTALSGDTTMESLRDCEVELNALQADLSAQKENFSGSAPSLMVQSMTQPTSSSSATSSSEASSAIPLPAFYIMTDVDGAQVLPAAGMLLENVNNALERLTTLRKSLQKCIYASPLADWRIQSAEPLQAIQVLTGQGGQENLQQAQRFSEMLMASLQAVIDVIKAFPPADCKAENLSQAETECAALTAQQTRVSEGLRVLEEKRMEAAFQTALSEVRPETLEATLKKVREKRGELQREKESLEGQKQDLEAQVSALERSITQCKERRETYRRGRPSKYRKKIEEALCALQRKSDPGAIDAVLTQQGLAELREAMSSRIQALHALDNRNYDELFGEGDVGERKIRPRNITSCTDEIVFLKRVEDTLKEATLVPYDTIAELFVAFSPLPHLDADGYQEFLKLLEPLEPSIKAGLERPSDFTLFKYGTNFSKKAVQPLKDAIERVVIRLSKRQRDMTEAFAQQQSRGDYISTIESHLMKLARLDNVLLHRQEGETLHSLQQDLEGTKQNLADNELALCENQTQTKQYSEKARVLEELRAFHQSILAGLDTAQLASFTAFSESAEAAGFAEVHRKLCALGAEAIARAVQAAQSVVVDAPKSQVIEPAYTEPHQSIQETPRQSEVTDNVPSVSPPAAVESVLQAPDTGNTTSHYEWSAETRPAEPVSAATDSTTRRVLPAPAILIQAPSRTGSAVSYPERGAEARPIRPAARPSHMLESIIKAYNANLERSTNRRFVREFKRLCEQVAALKEHATEINRTAGHVETGSQTLSYVRELMEEIAQLAESVEERVRNQGGAHVPTVGEFGVFEALFKTKLNNPPASMRRHRELWKPVLLNIALCIPLLFRLLLAPCTPGGFRFFGQNTAREDMVDDLKETVTTLKRDTQAGL